jgi:hypothetical protein
MTLSEVLSSPVALGAAIWVLGCIAFGIAHAIRE